MIKWIWIEGYKGYAVGNGKSRELELVREKKNSAQEREGREINNTKEDQKSQWEPY